MIIALNFGYSPDTKPIFCVKDAATYIEDVTGLQPCKIPVTSPQGKYARNVLAIHASLKKNRRVMCSSIYLYKLEAEEACILRLAGLDIVAYFPDEVWEEAQRADDEYWKEMQVKENKGVLFARRQAYRKSGYQEDGGAFRKVLFEHFGFQFQFV